MIQRRDFFVSPEELRCVRQVVAEDKSVAALFGLEDGGAASKATVRLSRDEAERVRELLTTELAKAGFNESYVPNEHGRLLESLIDRFYMR